MRTLIPLPLASVYKEVRLYLKETVESRVHPTFAFSVTKGSPQCRLRVNSNDTFPDQGLRLLQVRLGTMSFILEN